MRGRAGPGAAAAAAGLGAFVYWLIHGSVDWFWEFPALGGGRLRARGHRRRPGAAPGDERRRPLARGVPAVGVVAAAAVLVAASFGAPALSERLVNRAAAGYPRDPAGAFDQLDSAAALNPLSPRPRVIAGRIALSLGRPRDAERYFRQALEREPTEPYVQLQLGAILFDGGRRAEGLRALERAARLEPRSPITASAVSRARQGRRIDVGAINAALLARGRELVR